MRAMFGLLMLVTIGAAPRGRSSAGYRERDDAPHLRIGGIRAAALRTGAMD